MNPVNYTYFPISAWGWRVCCRCILYTLSSWANIAPLDHFEKYQEIPLNRPNMPPLGVRGLRLSKLTRSINIVQNDHQLLWGVIATLSWHGAAEAVTLALRKETWLSNIISHYWFDNCCKTLNFRVPFISQIWRTKQNREIIGHKYRHFKWHYLCVWIAWFEFAKIILHVNSPTFRDAKLKGFTVLICLNTLLYSWR